MATFKIKKRKVFLSSGMQKLLNKKINIYFQEKSKNSLIPRFIMPKHNELKQIQVSFLRKVKVIVIAFSLLFLYFIKIFVVISKSNKSKKNNTVLIFSLTKEQIFKNKSLYEFHEFLNSKKFSMPKNSKLLVECRGILRTKRFSNLIVTLDIPLKIFTMNFSLKQKIKCI